MRLIVTGSSVTNDENNNHFQGTEKLQNEIASIARSYKKKLADSGLSLNKDGTLSADKEVILTLIIKTP